MTLLHHGADPDIPSAEGESAWDLYRKTFSWIIGSALEERMRHARDEFLAALKKSFLGESLPPGIDANEPPKKTRL